MAQVHKYIKTAQYISYEQPADRMARNVLGDNCQQTEQAI